MIKQIYRAIRQVFDRTLRPYLPPKQIRLGGVEAYRGSVLDRTLTDTPEYEQAARNALQNHVQDGDHVRIVGAGSGVTAVVAAQNGADSVTVIEVAERSVQCARKTANLNDFGDIISVKHGYVGEVQNPRMGAWGPQISPEQCRDCDVLEMDCEGAEMDILTSFDPESLPRVIIVETHGVFGAGTSDVRRELTRLGYKITNKEAEDSSDDIFVLTAVQQ